MNKTEFSQIRSVLGLSQYSAAAGAGVSRGKIQLWEQGYIPIASSDSLLIRNYLGRLIDQKIVILKKMKKAM